MNVESKETADWSDSLLRFPSFIFLVCQSLQFANYMLEIVSSFSASCDISTCERAVDEIDLTLDEPKKWRMEQISSTIVIVFAFI